MYHGSVGNLTLKYLQHLGTCILDICRHLANLKSSSCWAQLYTLNQTQRACHRQRSIKMKSHQHPCFHSQPTCPVSGSGFPTQCSPLLWTPAYAPRDRACIDLVSPGLHLAPMFTPSPPPSLGKHLPVSHQRVTWKGLWVLRRGCPGVARVAPLAEGHPVHTANIVLGSERLKLFL